MKSILRRIGHNAVKMSKRIISFVLAFVMIFQMSYFMTMTPKAEEIYEATSMSANSKDYMSINGVVIDREVSLFDNGDGTFSLELSLSSSYSKEIESSKTMVAENGTHSITHDGWYLLELWGGNGASVENAGAGGDGGHVYAKVYLFAGQTIFYSLGSNGETSQKSNIGGGANGSGGGHGIVGSSTVGGGGGYSAIFLYDSGEFESTYGTLGVKNISEADRTSKYIMIAGGGGGGGGAESGSSRKANGGAGGGIGSANGAVGGENSVAGIYFAGQNGSSTGSSTAYVGKGGTNIPGATSNSAWGVTDADYLPPDNWFGTVDGRGGAGGSGELLGGGGGAGFAGGSGGLMTSVLFSTNIGGGGGGSSFIATTVNDRSVNYSSLDEKDSNHLINENPSAVGGAMRITYLDADDVSFLDNIIVRGCLSPYVVPVGADGFTAHDHNSNTNCEILYEEAEHNHETLIVSGFSLLNDDGSVGGSLHVSMKFTYSDGFLGGNHVPILYDHGYDYDSPMTLTFGDGHGIVLELGEACGYVNMPYNIEAHGHSEETNSPGTVFTVDSLYYDQFATVRDNLSEIINDPSNLERYKYNRIVEIGEYEVYDAAGEKLDVNGTVAPNSTTHYKVVLPIKIKPVSETGYATVGQKNVPDADGWIRFEKEVSIFVPGSRVEQLGKFLNTYTKNLIFDGENYVFSLEVKASTSKEHNIYPGQEHLDHKQDFDSSAVVEYDHVIEVTGWYLIQVWGGNGSDGDNSLIGGGVGGTGGKGGYLQGYVHLDRGDTVEVFMGVNGYTEEGWWKPGAGGKHSRVSVIDGETGESTVLMIAGGGGGGGSYTWSLFGGGKEGEPGQNVGTTITTGTPDATNEYSAYDGKKGDGSTGGVAGTNYINSELVKTVVSGEDGLDDYAQDKFNGALDGDYDAKAHGGGTSYIQCMQVTDDGASEVIQDISEALADYYVNTNISKYFKIEGVSFGAGQLDTSKPEPKVEYTYVNGKDTALSINEIYPKVSQSTSTDGKTHYASIEFTVNVTLSVADGFIGGNDVPLFDAVTLSHTQYELVDDVQTAISPRPSIVLGANDKTDFANVAIDYSILPTVTRPAHSLFYQPGDPAIEKSALYQSDKPLPVAPAESDANAWKYDYVEIVNSIEALPNELAPTHTTEYDVSVGIRPTYASSKANSDLESGGVANQEERVHSHTTIIFVGHEVIFNLTELTHDAESLHDRYAAELGEDYSFTLTPSEDYTLPDNITVSIGGNVIAEGDDTYTYVRGSGDVVIKKEAITDEVTVTAVAKAPKHNLYYYYAETPDSDTYEQEIQSYEEGESLDGAFHNTHFPSFAGYSFAWDWGDGNTVAPTVMPDGDLFAIGKFTPNSYTVTVNYLYGDGTSKSETHTYLYKEEYSINIEPISGYVATVGGEATTTVSGQMGAENITIDVEYIASEAPLTIIYLHSKTSEELKSYIFLDKYSTDANYSEMIEMPVGYVQSKDGVTPDPEWTVIEGVMPAGGISVTVYCMPKTYTVTFNSVDENGVSYEYAQRTVVFGEIYGNDENGEYFVFGEPSLAHHTFLGWYIENTETRVEEDDVVTDRGDLTLVAKWEAHTYTITIKYLLEDGNGAFGNESIETYKYEHGREYTFIAKELGGYTPDPPSISGTVAGQDVIFTFTYISNYPDGPIIEATVTWGDLSFGFEPGRWDPETHTYEDDIFTPNGDNSITVTNDSSHVFQTEGTEHIRKSISVNAEITFTALYEFRNLSGCFTRTADADSVEAEGIETMNLVVATKSPKKVYFWLLGNFEPTAIADYVIGSCTVTLRGGAIEE